MQTRAITKKTGGNGAHRLVTVTAPPGRQKVSLKLGALPWRQTAPDVRIDEIVFDLKKAIKARIALKVGLLQTVLFRLRHAIAEKIPAQQAVVGMFLSTHLPPLLPDWTLAFCFSPIEINWFPKSFINLFLNRITLRRSPPAVWPASPARSFQETLSK